MLDPCRSEVCFRVSSNTPDNFRFREPGAEEPAVSFHKGHSVTIEIEFADFDDDTVTRLIVDELGGRV